MINAIDHHFYNGYADKWDNKIFSDEVRKYINTNAIILDTGRGIDHNLNFRGLAQKVYGIDPIVKVLDNPFLDEAFVGYGDSMSNLYFRTNL